MRKLFFIIIFIFTIIPVSAEYWSYTIQLKSQVPRITLSDAVITEEGALGLYKLYGGFNSSYSSDISLLNAEDISKEDIVVNFEVVQVARTRTDESITLSVEADNLVNTESDILLSKDSSLIVSTEYPVISDVFCPDVESLRVSYTNDRRNEILFHLSYSINKPVENVSLAYFTGTWKRTEGAAPGIYISDITLSYITN